MSPTVLISIFVFIAIVTVIYIIRYSRLRKNRLRKLALDLGRETLQSGTTYEGEMDGRRFYYEYYTGSKNSPSYFRIWLDGPSQGGFRIGPESRLDIFFKRLGIAVEIQTGDSGFDRMFYIRTDHVAFTRIYLDRPETREAIKIIRRLGFTEISHDGRTVQARITPFTSSTDVANFNSEEVVKRLIELADRLPDESYEKRFAGMPAWKFRRNVVYTLNVLTAAGGLGLMLWGLATYTPLNAFDVFTWSTEFSVPALLLSMVIMVYMLKGRSSSHTDLLVNLGIAVFGFPLAGFGTATVLNGYLDVSRTEYHDAEVVGKRYSSSRNSRNYYVSLRSWNPGKQNEEIRINRSIYRKVNAGRTIMSIATHSGYLGFEWILDYRIKEQLPPPTRTSG